MNARFTKTEDIVLQLFRENRGNIYAECCYPWMWSETRCSHFFEKRMYPDAGIIYDKRRILRKFFRSLFGYGYCLLHSRVFKQKKLFGALHDDTELLIVNWIRNKDFLENDAYLKDLYKVLEEKGKKFQLLAWPLSKDFMEQGKHEEKAITKNTSNKDVPSLRKVIRLFWKNAKSLKNYDLSFWEKLMF